MVDTLLDKIIAIVMNTISNFVKVIVYFLRVFEKASKQQTTAMNTHVHTCTLVNRYYFVMVTYF